MRQVRDSRSDFLPEFGRVVQIDEIERPMKSDDEETAQTIGMMDKIAARDSNDRAVVAAVDEALSQANLTRNSPAFDKACAVFWWLKANIEYVPTPGTSPLVDQTLISPTALLAMPEAIGDCPQFSMLAAAMFRVLCMDSMFVTIAAEPMFPHQWSHVYNTVEIFPGQYIPFDSSNGPEPGAEYSQWFRRRVWPRIEPGKCQTKETASDMVRQMKKGGSMRNRNLRSALHGRLGDDGDYGGEAVNISTGLDPTSSGDYGGETTGSSISSGVPWYDQLISAGTSLAAPIVKEATQQQPYYVTGANGQQVLFNPNTGQIASGSLGSISPTALLVGVGILALVIFSGRNK